MDAEEELQIGILRIPQPIQSIALLRAGVLNAITVEILNS